MSYLKSVIFYLSLHSRETNLFHCLKMSVIRYSVVFILVFVCNAIVMVAQDEVVSVLDAVIDSLESPQGYHPVDSAYLHNVELLLEQENDG